MDTGLPTNRSNLNDNTIGIDPGYDSLLTIMSELEALPNISSASKVEFPIAVGCL